MSQPEIIEIKAHLLYIRKAVERMEQVGDRTLAALDRHERDDDRRFEAVNAKLNRIIGGLILAGALVGFATRVFGG